VHLIFLSLIAPLSNFSLLTHSFHSSGFNAIVLRLRLFPNIQPCFIGQHIPLYTLRIYLSIGGFQVSFPTFGVPFFMVFDDGSFIYSYRRCFFGYTHLGWTFWYTFYDNERLGRITHYTPFLYSFILFFFRFCSSVHVFSRGSGVLSIFRGISWRCFGTLRMRGILAQANKISLV